MKKVAFLRSAGVYNDSRSTKEIRALVSAGYFVEVICWNRDGKSEQKCPEVFSDIADKVSFSYYNVLLPDGIGFKNMDKLLNWFKWVIKTLSEKGELFAVHACDLDTGIPARKYCKKHKVKLVYDIFDYYIDSHYVPSFAQNVIEGLEIKVINQADITIICTEERSEQIAKSTPKKTIVIHNTPEMPEIPKVEEDNDYAYCGVLSGRRLVGEILAKYENNIDKKMSFAGHGEFAEKATQLNEKYDNFSFLGPISYSEVLSLEARSKVLSAIYEPTIRNHRLCAPNKFYEALALGKPVIVCKGTGIDKIVAENNIGYVIDYSAESFYNALNHLCEDDKLRQEMGQRARKLYEQKYNWEMMKKTLIDAYAQL